MRFLAGLIAVLLPAMAQAASFPVTVEGWTIAANGRWCNATNENVAPGADPHNALQFSQVVNSKLIYLGVYFPSGSFVDDQPVTLSVTLGDRPPVEMTGMTTGDANVSLDYALTDMEQSGFAKAGTIVVRANGVEKRLTFSSEGISEALDLLKQCGAALKE